MELKDIETCELVQELILRDGVEVELVEPYQNHVISVKGPATVLVVID